MDAEPSRLTLTSIAVLSYIGRAVRCYYSSKEIAKIRHNVPERVFTDDVPISDVRFHGEVVWISNSISFHEASIFSAT